MAGLRVALLGGFRASYEEKSLALAAKKAQALVAYLAASNGRPQTREHLAALLWSRSGPEHARLSLRQALSVLRRNLPVGANACLRVDGKSITLDTDHVDVFEFATFAAGPMPDALERAIEIYQGDFLDGFDISEPEFEQWMLVERRHLRELALQAMCQLLAVYRRDDQVDAAIRTALRLLALDPLQEPVHRDLMALYAQQERYANALQQYEQCRAVLHGELNLEPEEATKALYQQIRVDRARARLTSDDDAAEESKCDVRELVTSQIAACAKDADEGSGLAAWLLQRRSSSLSMAALISVLVVVGGAVWLIVQPDAPVSGPGSPSDEALVIPEGPKIAVLPFRNLSDDPNHKIFSDGLTEDVINGLTRFRHMFVFAGDTMLNYGAANVDVRAAGRDLDADYVLIGSVRRSEDRIRVTASLTDAAGTRLWAETYDRDLSARSVFRVQDEITARVVGAIADSSGVVARDRYQSARSNPPQHLVTYDCIYLLYAYWNQESPESHRRAGDCLERAVADDPRLQSAMVVDCLDLCR